MSNYTFEIQNAFNKMAVNQELINLVKSNDFFRLTTSTHHATASFKIEAIDKKDYSGSLTSPTYSKVELLKMCPANLLDTFFDN